MVPIGAIIANRIRLLSTGRRHHIPIHVVMVVGRPRRRLMRVLVDMLVLLGVVVVVEVVKSAVFGKMLLVGMRVRISGKMLLGGHGRKVVVCGRSRERRLAASEVVRFFRDGRWNVGVCAQLSTAHSRRAGTSQRVGARYAGGFGEYQLSGFAKTASGGRRT